MPKKSNIAPSYGKSTGRTNPVVNLIIEDLKHKNGTKKEIANRYHTDVGFVVKIINTWREEISAAEVIDNIISDESVEEMIEEVVSEPVVEETKTSSRSNIEEFMEFYDSGMSFAELAELFDIKEQSAKNKVNKYLKEHGREDEIERKRIRARTPELKSKIMELYESGKEVSEIESELKISKLSVTRTINEYEKEMFNKAQQITVEEVGEEEMKRGRRNKSAKRHSNSVYVKDAMADLMAQQDYDARQMLKNEETSKEEVVVEEKEEVISMDELEKVCEKNIISDIINNSEEDINVTLLENTMEPVGLIADRHNMPVKSYIFKDIDSKLMFDFAKQEQIVYNFIKNNIGIKRSPDGKEIGCKGLKIYTSGLISTLISTINVCNKLSMPVVIMNWDYDISDYREQPVYNGFSIEDDVIFKNILEKYNKIYMYDSTVADFKSVDMIYNITICIYHDGPSNKPYRKTILFKENNSDLWVTFGKYQQMIEQSKEQVGLFINKLKVIDGVATEIEGGIAKSFNFK